MVQPFRSFVIFAEMRTGSNHLEETLNSVPHLSCHGELFNPWFIGEENRTEMFDLSLEQRDLDPIVLLDRMRAYTPGLPGFRFFSDHDPRVLAHVLRDRTCAKVILSRPTIESYVSMRIADATGLWRITNTAHREARRIWFDPVEFTNFADQIDRFRANVRRALLVSGQVPFEMTFADILDVEVLNGLVRFLNLDHIVTAPSNRLKRQNPGPLRDKVTNPDEMEKTLDARGQSLRISSVVGAEEVDRYLGRLVVTEAPALLYIPLPGAPEPAMRDWLNSLGATTPGDPPQDEMSLRRWLNRTKQRQIFTVVCHPVLRAWRQFLNGAETGLPENPRAAFLSYLSAAGSAPETLPQSAVLSALSGVLLPDSILREEQLEQRLPLLLQTAGQPPRLPAPPPPHIASLNQIYDAEIESAVRALYTPDYRAFGYRKWAPAQKRTKP